MFMTHFQVLENVGMPIELVLVLMHGINGSGGDDTDSEEHD